jgi:predicted Zn-dependent protease
MGVNNTDQYASLSGLYRKAGDDNKALEVIRQGRTRYPDTLSLMYNEINLLLAMNRSSEASEVINKALERIQRTKAFTSCLATITTGWRIRKMLRK